MPKRRQPEARLYPLVAKWLVRDKRCFTTAENTGLKHSRIDVLGVRDVGGDLSGDIEVVSVEVKRGVDPFATATGQALGYRIYANRIYLADVRDGRFSAEEVDIANHLGVGLIRISAGKCIEQLSSPYYQTMPRMTLAILEKCGLVRCQFCGTFFQGGPEPKKNRFARLRREDVQGAIRENRGLMFWNRELAARKARLGVRRALDGSTHERRFVCPDCVEYVFSQLADQGTGR